MATSLQTITASVRDTLIDTLSEDWNSLEGRDAEVDYVWSEDKVDQSVQLSGEQESIESIASLQSDRGFCNHF